MTIPEVLWEYKPSDKPYLVTRFNEDGYTTICRFYSLEHAVSEAGAWEPVPNQSNGSES